VLFHRDPWGVTFPVTSGESVAARSTGFHRLPGVRLHVGYIFCGHSRSACTWLTLRFSVPCLPFFTLPPPSILPGMAPTCGVRRPQTSTDLRVLGYILATSDFRFRGSWQHERLICDTLFAKQPYTTPSSSTGFHFPCHGAENQSRARTCVDRLPPARLQVSLHPRLHKETRSVPVHSAAQGLLPGAPLPFLAADLFKHRTARSVPSPRSAR